MLWTVVVCDLVYKLQALRDMHGDAAAKTLLTEVEAKQKANPTSPDWEVYLLDEVVKRTNLLEMGEHVQLQGLQKLRHLSAHPVLTGTDLLFHPTKEAVRAQIRTALEAVLLKPPLFSKRIVTALVMDVATNKALLISKPTLKSFLDARYFSNMAPPVELELFRALWKFCFKLRNVDTDANRDINVAVLSVVFDRNPTVLRKAIDADRPYFSDVGPDSALIAALVGFLEEHSVLFGSLDPAAQILIQGHVDGDMNLKVKAAFRHPDFATHLGGLLAETTDAFDAVTEESWVRLLDAAQGEGLLQEACEIAIRNYGGCTGYDEADKRFARFIAPSLGRLDAYRLVKLLEAIEGNSQTFDRRRAKPDHREVAMAAAAQGVDTTTFRRFTENL